MVKSTTATTIEDILLAFAELSNAVMHLDIHLDDKLALRGMIEVRKTVEIARMRKDEDNDKSTRYANRRKLRTILRNN